MPETPCFRKLHGVLFTYCIITRVYTTVSIWSNFSTFTVMSLVSSWHVHLSLQFIWCHRHDGYDICDCKQSMAKKPSVHVQYFVRTNEIAKRVIIFFLIDDGVPPFPQQHYNIMLCWKKLFPSNTPNYRTPPSWSTYLSPPLTLFYMTFPRYRCISTMEDSCQCLFCSHVFADECPCRVILNQEFKRYFQRNVAFPKWSSSTQANYRMAECS